MRGLLYLALTISIIALARPQLGKSLTQVEASGIDIMLVLDVSGIDADEGFHRRRRLRPRGSTPSAK